MLQVRKLLMGFMAGLLIGSCYHYQRPPAQMSVLIANRNTHYARVLIETDGGVTRPLARVESFTASRVRLPSEYTLRTVRFVITFLASTSVFVTPYLDLHETGEVVLDIGQFEHTTFVRIR